MSKQRYIKDSFWTDPYIEKLTPDEKLVFIYLLTNPQCNIAGVYEIRSKRIAYETGYDIEVIETILKRFTRDKKIIKINDYIIIVNHLKHQSLGSKIAEGVNRIVEELPENIKNSFKKQEFSTDESVYDVYILDTLSIPYTYPSKNPVELGKVELSNISISKEKFGEFKNVSLKQEEYDKLLDSLGLEYTNSLIEELSGYMASKGKKYSSHYATILNWSRRRKQEVQDKRNYKSKNITII